MSSIRTYVLFITILFITLSCATSEKINDKSPVDVVQTKVDAWFDLMPGTSPGKFHLSGEVKLGNSNTTDMENIQLKTITVYSKEEVIYNFMPYFRPKLKEDDYSLRAGSSKEFMFGTDSGIKIDSRLEEHNVIDAKLNFTLGEDNFIYEIKDVEIQRVY